MTQRLFTTTATAPVLRVADHDIRSKNSGVFNMPVTLNERVFVAPREVDPQVSVLPYVLTLDNRM